MASIKNLKKEMTVNFGAILDECFFFLVINKGQKEKEVEALATEIEDEFDRLMGEINDKKAENRPARLKAIRREYQQSLARAVEKLNAME